MRVTVIVLLNISVVCDYVDLLNQRYAIISVYPTVLSKQASSWLFMFGCEWLLCCSLHPSTTIEFSTHSPPSMFWFEPQGSESESVNGPGRDSGLASSRLEPSATLPSRGGAESEPETMEGMLCRKQEMESHSKKAATRSVFSKGSW